MNLVPVDAENGALLQLLTGQGWESLHAAGIGTVGARPEDIGWRLGNDAQVQLVERLGAESLVHVRVAGAPKPLSLLSTDRTLAHGSAGAIHIPPQRLHRFDLQGRRLGP